MTATDQFKEGRGHQSSDNSHEYEYGKEGMLLPFTTVRN